MGAPLWALSTSLRTQSTAHTLAKASGLMAGLGITELSDATGHDVLDVPVWFSVRPQGLTTRVHCGKGLDGDEARVGALMEAIEHAAAELAAARGGGTRIRLDAMLAQFSPPLTIADFAPRLGAALSPGHELLADACEDIASGTSFQLPAELLRLPAPDEGVPGGLFGGWTSNGLASGNSFDEATLHALLEVIERDSVALDLARPSARQLEHSSLPAAFAGWAERWSASGIELRLRPLVNEFDLPCFEAEIEQAGSIPPRRSLGFGLHPRRSMALARAVAEAAQSRLYALRFDAAAAQPGQRRGADIERTKVDFASLPDWPADDVTGTLARLIDRLRERGLRWVLRRSLNLDAEASDLQGLHVVRVVVPGCETALGRHPRVGRRLAARLGLRL